MKFKHLIITIILLFAGGCDLATPQTKFRLAIPKGDYFYSYIAKHLVPFLERNGFEIKVIYTENAIEANLMVANGEAELTLIANHSVPITNSLGIAGGRLRTVLPITSSLFFAFSKEELADTATVRDLFANKKIGIEVLNGEAQSNLETFISEARIKGSKIVLVNDDPDVRVFWGTLYGTRASQLLSEGWHPFSFKENWIEFQTLNDPALRPFTLPAVPGDQNSIRINTIATEILLAVREDIGENSIYKLAQVIFQNKLELVHQDLMYRSITEKIDNQALLYPLHEGTSSYLRRDQPTFFERYADTIALVFSIIAVLYGAMQAIRSNLARRKKEQIDKYFLDFLDIRSNKVKNNQQIVKELDDLFQRAVVQMTNEKLEKADFHILSRLIQQEINNLKV